MALLMSREEAARWLDAWERYLAGLVPVDNVPPYHVPETTELEIVDVPAGATL